MIERIGQSLAFVAFFTSLRQGKTGLSVTVDVFDPTGAKVVNGATAAEIGDGGYTYSMSGTLNTVAGNYFAVFKTTDGTVDFQWVPALWTVGEHWVQGLTPTAGVAVDANVRYVNGVQVSGTGASGDEWGPA